MRFLLRMLVSAAVIFGVARYTGGALVPETSFTNALVLALVLALVNAFIKPIVHLLSLPITILTLGLFSLVINALMLLLAEAIVGLESPGFWATLLAALVISVLTSAFTRLIDSDDENRRR